MIEKYVPFVKFPILGHNFPSGHVGNHRKLRLLIF